METTAHATQVKLALKLTDAARLPMLLEILRHFDFIETAEAEQVEGAEQVVDKASAFHALAGIWAERDITAEELRQQAWGGRGV